MNRAVFRAVLCEAGGWTALKTLAQGLAAGVKRNLSRAPVNDLVKKARPGSTMKHAFKKASDAGKSVDKAAKEVRRSKHFDAMLNQDSGAGKVRKFLAKLSDKVPASETRRSRNLLRANIQHGPVRHDRARRAVIRKARDEGKSAAEITKRSLKRAHAQSANSEQLKKGAKEVVRSVTPDMINKATLGAGAVATGYGAVKAAPHILRRFRKQPTNIQKIRNYIKSTKAFKHVSKHPKKYAGSAVLGGMELSGVRNLLRKRRKSENK